jgi:hypothetical protein
VKHKEASTFLARKLHSNLQKLILQDPNMARVFGAWDWVMLDYFEAMEWIDEIMPTNYLQLGVDIDYANFD